MEELETPATTNGGETTTDKLQKPINGETISTHEPTILSDDIDSCCSTPYVSAPSSPGRGTPLGGFYYSAPASPMHCILSTSSTSSKSSTTEATASSMSSSFEFEFSARLVAANGSASAGLMSSADELFLNGQIRPMKLSTHLQRPQNIEETNDGECDDNQEKSGGRGRDLNLRDKCLRRRTRSMSPLRTTSFNEWEEEEEDDDNERKSTDAINAELDVEGKHTETVLNETTPSGSSSRSSSVGRSSNRWIFLKEFLNRSKSEGRNNGHKFWSSLSFSPVKDKKPPAESGNVKVTKKMKQGVKESNKKQVAGNGVGRKRRVARSAHELHYTANRAQAEEMRKKTYLPYRQGLLGCLGFSSKSYGAMNGFATALNPVYSRH